MNKTIFKMKCFFDQSVSVLTKKGVFFQLESLVTMRKSLKLPLLRCPRMSHPERSRFLTIIFQLWKFPHLHAP